MNGKIVFLRHNRNWFFPNPPFFTGRSMVGQSILLNVAEGDKIRLKNFGGDIYEDESTSNENFLHFTGVLLYSSDRS